MAQLSPYLTTVMKVEPLHRQPRVRHHHKVNGQECALWRILGATLQILIYRERLLCQGLAQGASPDGAVGGDATHTGGTVQQRGDDAER